MKNSPSACPRLRGSVSVVVATLFLVALLARFSLPAQAAATAAPAAPARATERIDPELVAKLPTAPALPYTVDANWPELPAGYNFGECSGVDVDRQGNVWVFNRGRWPMIQFNRAGKFLQAWSADSFRVLSSHGVRVGPDGNLWCVDVAGHCVFKVSPAGRILMLLGIQQGNAGNNDSQDGFNRPTNVAFRANGNVYISDGYINGRIVEYTSDGYYVRHWGRRGMGDGEFHLVHDVTVDTAGRVYVADRTNERVQIFDADGKFIDKWTGFGAPWGLYFVAKENTILMCDGKNNRISEFSLEGKLLGTLSAFGKAPGKLDYVHSIAVDPADSSIYTVEIKNWRVQKWTRAQR